MTNSTAREFREPALLAYKSAEEKQLREPVLLEIGKVSIVADYFLVATGDTPVQLRAACDHLLSVLKDAGHAPLRIEGYRDGWWILLDFGSLVIHLFQPDARDFYNLERLWSKAPVVKASPGKETAGGE